MERAGIVAEPASSLECRLAWAVEHARRLDPLTDLGWLPAGNPLKEAPSSAPEPSQGCDS